MTFFQRNKKTIIIILIVFPILIVCACVTIAKWALKQPQPQTDTPKSSISTPTTDSLFLASTETQKPNTSDLFTSTSTITPTIFSTVEVTKTMEATLTKTSKPTSTLLKGPSPTPTPSLSKIFGNIWSNVNVYYGNSPKVVFKILGGNDNCSAFPSGRGIYVEYPDGSKEWKDREYIISSGLFFVNKNDPAIKAFDWYIYPCD